MRLLLPLGVPRQMRESGDRAQQQDKGINLHGGIPSHAARHSRTRRAFQGRQKDIIRVNGA
jgi:hypothetical protein